MARAFPDEQTGIILEVFEFIARFSAVVPQLWRIEVANSLNVGIRRRRITMEDRSGILADLEDLPILVDNESRNHTWGDTLALADKHRLTVYDATYLELALRLSLPLATLDDDLRNAALREGVLLLGK
jgi:predicted nucleic acid-binding protein